MPISHGYEAHWQGVGIPMSQVTIQSAIARDQVERQPSQLDVGLVARLRAAPPGALSHCGTRQKAVKAERLCPRPLKAEGILRGLCSAAALRDGEAYQQYGRLRLAAD